MTIIHQIKIKNKETNYKARPNEKIEESETWFLPQKNLRINSPDMINIKHIILITNSRMHCVKKQMYVLKISISEYTTLLSLRNNIIQSTCIRYAGAALHYSYYHRIIILWASPFILKCVPILMSIIWSLINLHVSFKLFTVSLTFVLFNVSLFNCHLKC